MSFCQIADGPLYSARDLRLVLCRKDIAPRKPGANGMCSEIRTTPIERQRAPAAAKRGDTTVAILQVQEPFDAERRGGPDAFVCFTQMAQRQHCTRRIIGVGHPARQVSPGPAARRSAGVRMHLTELLI